MIWIYKDFIIENINKNIFNNLLINVSRYILFFQKLPSRRIALTSTPEPKSAPVLLK